MGRSSTCTGLVSVPAGRRHLQTSSNASDSVIFVCECELNSGYAGSAPINISEVAVSLAVNESAVVISSVVENVVAQL